MMMMMMGRKRVLLALLTVIVAASLSACSTYKEGQKLTITGRLRLVGNEPFTHLVVTTTDNKDFYLPDQSRNEYRRLIGSQVTVDGTLSIKKLELADHSKTFTQYHLTDITAFKRAAASGG